MLTADSGMLANTWLALLAMAGVAALVVHLRHAQSGKRPPARRRSAARHCEAEQEAGDLAELAERIERVSQEAGRQLEARCARLEALIGQAEDCLARLDRARDASRRPAPRPRAGRTQSSTAEGGCATLSLPDDGSAIHSLPENGGATPGPRQAGRLDHGPDPRAFRVCELAAAGRTAISIAEELGMPLGEVELVLNIRNFR